MLFKIAWQHKMLVAKNKIRNSWLASKVNQQHLQEAREAQNRSSLRT
jgi:hypothetical protein